MIKVKVYCHIGQRSMSQGQKFWHKWKGHVTRNTHLKYESPIYYGSRVMINRVDKKNRHRFLPLFKCDLNLRAMDLGLVRDTSYNFQIHQRMTKLKSGHGKYTPFFTLDLGTTELDLARGTSSHGDEHFRLIILKYTEE